MGNERTIEYSFVLKSLAETNPITVLDVGTGKSALPALMSQCGLRVIATDNIKDYWPAGMVNRHFDVIQDDIVNTQLPRMFDLITCVSVLEHIQEYEKAISSMFSLLDPGGHLLLTFPYNENVRVENIYDDQRVNQNVIADCGCRIFCHDDIDKLMLDNDAFVTGQEFWQVFGGELWQIGERIKKPAKAQRNEKHHLTCILMQKA